MDPPEGALAPSMWGMSDDGFFDQIGEVMAFAAALPLHTLEDTR